MLFFATGSRSRYYGLASSPDYFCDLFDKPAQVFANVVHHSAVDKMANI
jgi:hypothetical protein